jgi:hypothetical protein
MCYWASHVGREPSQCLCQEPVVEVWQRRVVLTPPAGFERLVAFAPTLYFCAAHCLEGVERRRSVAGFMSLERHQASIRAHFQVEPIEKKES